MLLTDFCQYFKRKNGVKYKHFEIQINVWKLNANIRRKVAQCVKSILKLNID